MRLVVLGALAQSPRARLHAEALTRAGARVETIAFDAPGRPLASLSWLDTGRLPRALRAPWIGLRGLALAAGTARALLAAPRPDVILVQSPPALPVLPLAVLAARHHRARLVIDWHNLGFSLLALRLGEHSPLVTAARLAELAAGRRADAHLCVSAAMQAALAAQGIDAQVFLDAPPEGIRPLGAEDLHALQARHPGFFGALADGSPPLTALAGGRPQLRDDRPALVVCASSFTADERMEWLVAAARILEPAVRAGKLPRLLLAATGRGPGRARLEVLGAGLDRACARLLTGFLPARDYAALLGAADVGVSLHASSSGLDLPMKIADMLAARLPVLALDYGPVLREQLALGEEAIGFRDAAGLAEALAEVLEGFPRAPRLATMRELVSRRHRATWEDLWTARAAPVIL